MLGVMSIVVEMNLEVLRFGLVSVLKVCDGDCICYYFIIELC